MNACFSCGKDSEPLFSVGCVNSKIRACRGCIRQHGVRELKTAADVALEFMLDPKNRPAPPPLKCKHCSNPVVMDADGLVSIFCTDCQREWQRVANSS